MATTTHIPLSEYLQTSYRPDREYVDGELRERNVGLWSHSRTTALLAGWIGKHEREWGVIAGISPRVQVSESRVRVPDLAVVLPGSQPGSQPGPQPGVLVDSPLLVIEILSPNDSYSDTQEREQDYREMGVETVWIIDPKTRTGRMCSGANWVEAKRLTVAGTPLFVELEAIFGQL